MIKGVTLAVVGFALPAFAAELLPSGPGFAAKYAGDAGIEKDSRVVQVENFEQPDIATLAAQWESVGAKGDMSFTAHVPPGSAGKQSLLMNDVGDSNGEQALWLDGKLVAHLGKGFPKGRWTFDKFEPLKGGGGVRWDDAKGDREHFEVPEGGAPFEGFRWRTVPELNVNYVWLYVYTEKEAGHRIRVWYDDVVVATEYIGPLKDARK